MTASQATDITEAYKRALPDIQARSSALLGLSWAERLAALPPQAREDIFSSMSPGEFRALLADWQFWGRPKQLATCTHPEAQGARYRVVCGGRGFGKSRTGAEWIRWRVEDCGAQAVGLIGPTYRDVANYMLGGRRGQRGNGSGLLDVFPAGKEPRWLKTDGVIEFHTGAIGYVFTAEEPELRGPNLDTVWLDELCKWRFRDDLFDNIELALRSDDVTPGGIITTTPKNFLLLKQLIGDRDNFVLLSSSDENRSNLDKSYLKRMDKRYSGTAVERQERHGEIIEDGDSLFKLGAIEAGRRPRAPETLVKIVVSVDPAVSTNRKSDLIGIVVEGIDEGGDLWVLEELSGVEFERPADRPRHLKFTRPKRPRKLTPDEWGELVVRAALHFRADAVIGERNRGGDLVAANVRAAARLLLGQRPTPFSIEDVLATRGKATRAEPVATMYNQGRVHHAGVLAELEDEMTGWDPSAGGPSPNRVDALVWGAHALCRFDEDLERAPHLSGLLKGRKRRW